MIKPKISVIIPCFNNGGLLSEMVNCMRNQTLTCWELIIVDDQSTDNTPFIIKELEKIDSRIKLFIRDRGPKGSVVCRNIGFNNSQGEFIMHLDADDLISDTCLENRLDFMLKNPEIDYASFPAKTFYDSNSKEEFIEGARTWGVPNDKDLLTSFLSADYPFSVWCNIYKKSAIRDIYWDEKVKIYTDFSFIIPCILNGLKHKFSNASYFDYYYRVNYSDDNMCNSFVKIEKNESTIYLFKKTLDLLESETNYLKLKKDFLHFVILHFERLIMDGSKIKIDNYLSFFEKYYSSFKVFSLLGITKITLCFSNLKIRKAFLYLLLGIRFGYVDYLKILFLQLKKIK